MSETEAKSNRKSGLGAGLNVLIGDSKEKASSVESDQPNDPFAVIDAAGSLPEMEFQPGDEDEDEDKNEEASDKPESNDDDSNKHTPPPKTPKPDKSRREPPVRNGSGRAKPNLGSIAIGLSIVAIMYTGVVHYMNSGPTTNEVEIAAINDAMIRINLNMDDLAVRVAQSEKRLESVESIAGSIANIQSQLKRQGVTISEFSMLSENNKQAIVKLSSTVADLNKSVADMGKSVKATKVAAVRAATASRPAVKKVESTLNGVAILTRDNWGGSHYINFKDPKSGKYTSLRVGEEYGGWELIAASSSEAEFRQGNKTKYVRIGG